MKKWIVIAVFLLGAGYISFLVYQNIKEKERLAMLEARKAEIEAKKKEIRSLETKLASLEQEISEANVSLDKGAAEFSRKQKNIKVRSRLYHHKVEIDRLKDYLYNFNKLDSDPLIKCFNECLPYNVFDNQNNIQTGHFISCNCFNCRHGGTYHGMVFICSRHKNPWNKEKYEEYHILHHKWQLLKRGHQSFLNSLKYHESMAKKIQKYAGSDEVLGLIDKKKSEIEETKKKIEELKKTVEELEK